MRSRGDRVSIGGDDAAKVARHTWPGVLTAALLLAATLSACTSADPDPVPTAEGAPPVAGEGPDSDIADAADREACGLLPANSLTEVLGETAAPTAIPSSGWAAGQCTWSGETAGFALSIGTEDSIAAFDDAAEPDAEAKVEAFRQRVQEQGGSTEDVSGVGDSAVVGGSGLAARIGGTYLEIENLSLSEEELIEIARLAAENIAG
jgi:hypothetical protein